MTGRDRKTDEIFLRNAPLSTLVLSAAGEKRRRIFSCCKDEITCMCERSLDKKASISLSFTLSLYLILFHFIALYPSTSLGVTI